MFTKLLFAFFFGFMQYCAQLVNGGVCQGDPSSRVHMCRKSSVTSTYVEIDTSLFSSTTVDECTCHFNLTSDSLNINTTLFPQSLQCGAVVQVRLGYTSSRIECNDHYEQFNTTTENDGIIEMYSTSKTREDTGYCLQLSTEEENQRVTVECFDELIPDTSSSPPEEIIEEILKIDNLTSELHPESGLANNSLLFEPIVSSTILDTVSVEGQGQNISTVIPELSNMDTITNDTVSVEGNGQNLSTVMPDFSNMDTYTSDTASVEGYNKDVSTVMPEPSNMDTNISDTVPVEGKDTSTVKPEVGNKSEQNASEIVLTNTSLPFEENVINSTNSSTYVKQSEKETINRNNNPVDVNSMTTVLPVDVNSMTTVLPVDVNSMTTVLPDLNQDITVNSHINYLSSKSVEVTTIMISTEILTIDGHQNSDVTVVKNVSSSLMTSSDINYNPTEALPQNDQTVKAILQNVETRKRDESKTTLGVITTTIPVDNPTDTTQITTTLPIKSEMTSVSGNQDYTTSPPDNLIDTRIQPQSTEDLSTSMKIIPIIPKRNDVQTSNVGNVDELAELLNGLSTVDFTNADIRTKKPNVGGSLEAGGDEEDVLSEETVTIIIIGSVIGIVVMVAVIIIITTFLQSRKRSAKKASQKDEEMNEKPPSSVTQNQKDSQAAAEKSTENSENVSNEDQTNDL